MANWNFSNIPGVSSAANEIIRAYSVLGCGVVSIEGLEAMVDLVPSEWTLALLEIDAMGVGVFIADDCGRQALFVGVTPVYGTP